MLPAPFVMMLLSCCKLRCVTHYLLIPFLHFLGLVWLFCFARNFVCPPMGYLLSPPTCQFFEIFGSFHFAPFFTWIDNPRNILFLWIDNSWNILFTWIDDPQNIVDYVDRQSTDYFVYVDRRSTEYC